MSKHKRVVLLGMIGAGKTSLFNLITKSNQISKQGGLTVTRRVLIGSSQYLKGFEILDTPGFLPKETIESLAGVFAGLYYGDVHQILLVVKNDRIPIMFEQVRKIVKKVEKLKRIITIVVTCFDLQVEDPEKQKQLFSETIIEQIGITSFIFLSNPEETRADNKACQAICFEIEKILEQKLNQNSLTFTASKEIFENLKTPDYVDKDNLEKAADEIELQFSKISNIYRKFIKEFNYKDPNTLDIMHALQLDIKDQADKIINIYIDKYGQIMNEKFKMYSDNVQYIFYIKLKQQITLDYQEVIKLAQIKMKEANIKYFDWIKRCPNCKLVWVKVYGCGGKTKCGNRYTSADTNQFINQSQQMKKFEFYIENGKLNVKKIDIQSSGIWNYKTIITQFVIENQLVETSNQDEIFQIIIKQLQDLKEIYFKDILDILKAQQKNQLSQIDVPELQVLKHLKLLFQQLIIFLRKEEIIEILFLIWGYQIYEYFDQNKTFFDGLLKLFSEDAPAFTKDCSLLTLTEEKWLENMTFSNQSRYLAIIRYALQQNQNKQQEVYIGCGQEFIWDSEPPLSEELLKALFSPDLFDYLNDFIKIENSSNEELEDKDYQQNLQQFQIAIAGKLKQIQVLK